MIRLDFQFVRIELIEFNQLITSKKGVEMTDRQLRYWELEETKRKNRTSESQRGSELSETSRHNRAAEGIDIGKLAETTRSNKAREGIDIANLAEATRSHKANERISKDYNEGQLKLRGKELAETTRSHKANEANTEAKNVIDKQNADTKQWEAQLQADKNEIQKKFNDDTISQKEKENAIREFAAEAEAAYKAETTTQRKREWIASLITSLYDEFTVSFDDIVKSLGSAGKFISAFGG